MEWSEAEALTWRRAHRTALASKIRRARANSLVVLPALRDVSYREWDRARKARIRAERQTLFLLDDVEGYVIFRGDKEAIRALRQPLADLSETWLRESFPLDPQERPDYYADERVMEACRQALDGLLPLVDRFHETMACLTRAGR